MRTVLHRLATFLGLISPVAYAYPAIDLSLPGDRHLHLVGSIHMGTMDMAPLPETLLARLAGADALIVEADISGNESPFGEPPPQPPLAERLPPAQYQRFLALCDTLSANEAQLEPLPAWQVALMLQARQAQQLGLRPEYGIDYQLIAAAHTQQKRIIELEGPQQQVELLLQLPQDGLMLLEDTLTHWHTNARLLQTMMGWWMDNSPKALKKALPSTFSNDLYDVLMHQRNQRWQQQLAVLPPGRYVVAVGALHLYGEGNLPDLLRAGSGAQ
ncbi:MAG: TraB/GumN family protein [Yersiniaceae bacterium]|uniref:Conjugal transfer protein TraB n=1 Tax=Chimaeribacter coloradensis TaxID=2060068 RepID=A0A2N5EB09_9GAMM|nr:TraB/GumN family protein [Chimaeribacter coloradensis]MDU6412459.1 TraB/GumN family protein [Yersiniaceae bacterium]PLR39331.1 conjugal transfer protein TraB [Chimaeribacter coloradensis]